MPKRVFELRVVGADQIFVEENEAEIVAAAIHLPGVIGVFHEWLQILLANRNCREYVA